MAQPHSAVRWRVVNAFAGWQNDAPYFVIMLPENFQVVVFVYLIFLLGGEFVWQENPIVDWHFGNVE